MSGSGNLSDPSELARQKRALLDFLLREEAGIDPASALRIQPRNRREAPPLSFAQQRLWFLDQWEPASPAYNIPAAIRLSGRLDAAALGASLDEIVRRHESLRTTFAAVDGEPVQIIAGKGQAELRVCDLRGSSEDGRAAELARLAADEARRPFDLENGPLLRVRLARLSEDEHALLVNMHHIISDGWSMGVLVRELVSFYAARLGSNGAAPLDLPIQYADFAIWQREWLQGERLEEQLRYWKEKLAGAHPPLQVPSDRPRPAVLSTRGSFVSEVFPKRLSDALAGLGRREGVTTFMMGLAAFQTLLHRYSGQTDISVGTPIANRALPETEGLIGLFANTLVLRTDLSGAPRFRELLRQVRETTLEAYSHQDVPFERLVEELAPERDASRQPLFQVMFVNQNAPMPDLEMPGLTIEELEMDSGTSKFDLTMTLDEREDGVGVAIEYATDLFDRSTIERMMGHFRTLLAGIVADPDRSIADLPILPEDERRLLAGGGGRLAAIGAAREPDVAVAHRCLHELFGERAASSPNALAAVADGRRMSYGELDERASRLARALREHGVGPEALVGLCLDRSIGLVVGIVGILKAGGAYVPLDLSYPKERQELILRDSQARVIVTQPDLAGRYAAAGAHVICLDANGELAGEGSTGQARRAASDRARRAPSAGNTAYVIYTSGSTGTPKGVAVSHGNVTRLFDATRPWFHFDERDVWTLFHSCAFDFSVWELWGALLHGGRLVIVPWEVTRTPEAFHELLAREEVTVLNQTPSYFRQLIRADGNAPRERELSLRLVIFGGEALELQSLRGWFERHGELRPRLVNMYGITETTIHVTYRPLSMADLTGRAASLVGGPIPDQRVCLLDERGHLVPIGVPGEMCVAGAGVARGYLHRPDLTAERFVPDQFGDDPGARFYRSGDLARRLANGDLEYLGRIDHQVKIRGYRIEPGEIEAAIDSHPHVRECVVALGKEPGEGRAEDAQARLIGWVVPSKEALTIDDLREHLRGRLPEHMIPSAWVFLESLPVTSHGKVDRSALPAPGGSRPQLREGYAPPRDPVERTLATVWADVLGVEKVGIHDNFFALGGDSIRSIQLRARSREAGFDFSIQQLFQHQTIADLSRRVTVGTAGRVQRREPFSLISAEERAALPTGVENAYPLSQLQAGFVFHSEYSSDYIVYITSFTLRARFALEPLRESLARLVTRHPMLRTSFDMTGAAEPLQLVHAEAEVPIEVEDLRACLPDEQQSLLESWKRAELKRRFDWKRAPLARIHVHRLTDESFHFALSEPFLDGWSVATLLTELFGGYFDLLEGGPLPTAAPLASTYCDFVALEREAIGSRESRDYWNRMLGDVTIGRFPRWSVPQTGAHGELPVGRIDVPIPEDVSDGLRDLARASAVPLKSALLAAHLKAVSLLTGSSEVLTGLISNGRPEERDGERVVGLFLNTPPLRVRLPQGSWAALAHRAFEAERELTPHRRFPMAELQRTHGGAPLFDTVFNYTNFHVYRTLAGVEGLEVLDADGSEQTYFALTAQFNLDTDASRISAALDYRAAEVSHEQARAIGALYARVLAAMAANPAASHAETGALTGAERNRVLVGWNETAKRYPPSPSIHALIEAQVEKTPEAVAVDLDGQRLTYRQLDQRANQLAHHLRSHGVGPEVLVGICLHRSFDIVVGVLGVLKAGGAYVPADPSYPPERIAFMMEDALVPVLLTQQRLAESVPSRGAAVIRLDSDWDEISRRPRSNPDSGVVGDNVAYVLYTSGSTGIPKGAAVTHRATVNLLNWARDLVPPEDLCGVLASTSICFDPSVFELFVPLSWGGKVILAENVLHLPALAASNDVTLLSTVPSAIAQLVKIDGIPRSVRTVTLAGEPLRNSLLERVHRNGSVRRVFNLYGLTEDAVYSTSARVEGGDGGGEFASIGRPIPNTRIYILDEFLQPVAPGVAGEIHVGGIGLPRGYFNRPELTAEKFIPDPFGAQPGARLHRTGDLARWLPDGNIEFLGRIDHQVKVRGFRIELGEIESVLTRYPQVREALVVTREDAPGERSLVAYLVASEGAKLSLRDLRGFLKEQLPDFMMPEAFVILPAFPLTPNGKLNRSALPAPGASRLAVEEEFVAPRTPVEEVLAGVWSRIFRVDRVGVRGNFFEMGGHSLLATQVISRARDAFHRDIPLRWLFEAPTIAGLAGRIEEALRSGVQTRLPAISKRQGSEPPPLSFAQQRLWFLDQLEPDNPLYNVSSAVRLTGRLDHVALQSAFREIIRRHETLRTTFDSSDGRPVQRIAERIEWSLPVVDLSGAPSSPQRDEQVRGLAMDEARTPFDLAAAPLIRARLLRLHSDDHVLLVTMHHIVSDGWSIGILVGELTALYEAFAAGRPSPLPQLPVQYSDFAAWQAEWLRGEELERQLEYWKEHLAGAPPALDLPTDKPRPAVQAWRGAQMPVEIASSLAAGLRDLSRREETTLFMTLLAAFATLLSRWSGQQDVVVGTPIANRNHSQIEGLIGFFVNTLAVRTDLSGDPTFRALLRRVRESALGAYAHQDLPFERLVEAVDPPRDLARTPLFQVMFDLHNMPARPLELPGLRLESLDVDPATAKFDLTLTLAEDEDGISGTLEYNTDLFEAPTAARMVGQLEVLLGSIVGNPESRLSRLPILPEDESARLLGFGQTVAPEAALADENLCVHEIIGGQALRRAESVAVRTAGSGATYGELNEAAGHLALRMRSQGVGPESRVGICAERSIEMIVGILAVLKAGGAYVPLDPDYPQRRLAQMLEDALPVVVLAQPRFVDRLAGCGAPVLPLDETSLVSRPVSAGRMDGGEAAVSPEGAASAGNAAYVIFTSGSTGRPRGVVVSHRSLVASTRARRLTYRAPVERFLLLSSFSFDSSVAGIFWTLCEGATLCLLPEGAQHDAREISRAVAAERITHMLCLPSLYRQVLDHAGEGQLSSLRAVICAGERFPADLVEMHRSKAGAAGLFNEYGPTEATVWATVHDSCGHDGASRVPIGRPIPGARIYVLDAYGQLVPTGAVGELCIAGETLSRGYLCNPDATAEKFLPDPLSKRAGARLYRTGDLARWSAGGELEFLGRNDHQVKLRGWRIELEEIEAALRRCRGVREAVVVGRAGAVAGEAGTVEQLVAYLVVDSRAPEGSRGPSADLRAELGRSLPAFMVPSTFVFLDSLPRTATGKVDHAALPAPDRARPELECPYVAPRDSVEEALAAIWSELLGKERVGVHDNFFDLGGHSLIATQVVSRVRENLRTEVPLRGLFESPTVAELAAAVLRAAGDPRQVETTARLLLDVARLSDDEVETILGG